MFDADPGFAEGQTIPAVFVFRPVISDDVAVTRVWGRLGSLPNPFSCQVGALPEAQGLVWCKALTGNLANGSETEISLRAADAAGNVSLTTKAAVRVDSLYPSARRCPAARSR